MEMAESRDDLLSLQSFEGRRVPDFEMLDAKIASALRKIISNYKFRRRVKSVLKSSELKNMADFQRETNCVLLFCPRSSNRSL